jgi:uncharacterized protein (DUF58 family)
VKGARLRLTREGAALAAFTVAAVGVGLLSGNNLVLAVGVVLVGLWVLEAFLGGWNLRHLEVARSLPVELYAGIESRGMLQVANRRNWLASWAVRVREDGVGGALAVVPRVECRGTVGVPVGWRFHQRGPARLHAVCLASAWPFGLLIRERRIPLVAELLVYPRPRFGPRGSAHPDLEGPEHDDGGRGGPYGDFAGLDPYRPGDRPLAIHWATTARVGEPMVIRHTGLAGECVVVRVADCAGRAWEDALNGACGEVLRGFEQRCAVGLHMPDCTLEPRAGGTWRRALLDTLARAPRREER